MKKYIKDGIIKSQYEIVIVEDIEIDGEKLKKSYIARSEEEILNAGWLPYEDIEEVRKEVLNKIIEYDKSEAVNSFIINGITAWIDRDTRASLVNSTNSRLKLNETTTALWLDGIRIEIPCEILLQLLAQLEVYALNCYDVTEQHKVNVSKLGMINEIKEYNFTINYPEKLQIEL